MKSKTSLAFLLLATTLLCSCGISSMMYYSIKLKKTESEIVLYGKIVDQFGEALSDVKVPYEISSYGLLIKPHYTHGNATSNEKGLFEIHHHKGGILYLKAMEKKGYDGRLGGCDTDIFEFRKSRRDRHRASKENPVVFHLRRKMTEAVMLLDRKMTVSFHKDKDEMWWGWDLLETKHGTLKNKDNPERHWDIEATGNVNPEKEEWTVTFRVNGEKAGMCFSDEFLYEAPLEGYETEITKTCKFNKKNIDNRDIFPVRHLYLKIRDLMLYARLDVYVYYADENRFSLRFEGNLNPYGTRSLEPLKSINDMLTSTGRHRRYDEQAYQSSSLMVECRKNALEALRQNRLPEKPDFEQWVKDGLAKY